MSEDDDGQDFVKIGVAAAALGVSVDTLRRWERAGKITFERQGRQRFISGAELSRVLRNRGNKGRSSARNHFQGTVVGVKKDTVMAQIEMICGTFRVVSLMSREAADELELKPGSSVTAVVKSTNVIVETPR
jgi:molybdopterin-binding protein